MLGLILHLRCWLVLRLEAALNRLVSWVLNVALLHLMMLALYISLRHCSLLHGLNSRLTVHSSRIEGSNLMRLLQARAFSPRNCCGSRQRHRTNLLGAVLD